VFFSSCKKIQHKKQYTGNTRFIAFDSIEMRILVIGKRINQLNQRRFYSSEKKVDIFHTKTPEQWRELFEKRQEYGIVKHLKFEFVSIEHKKLTARIQVKQENHMAPNGYMHAAAQVFLADTACGFGAYAHLPSEDKAFTTIELKSNFLGTAKPGDTLYCLAELRHAGKSTQVWDAECYLIDEKTGERKKTTSLFRCTQAILDQK